MVVLVLRLDAGFDFVDAQLVRDRSRRSLVVARQHYDLHSELMQMLDRAWRRFFNWISHSKDAAWLTSNGNEDCSLSLLLKFRCFALQCVQSTDTAGAK